MTEALRHIIKDPTLKEIKRIIVKIRKMKNLSEREVMVYVAWSPYINRKIKEIENGKEKKHNWYSWLFG